MPDQFTGIGSHRCGGEFELVSEAGTFAIYGSEIPVEQLFFRCNTCGDEQVTEELAAAVQSAAARAYRERFQFLTGAAIRAVRDRLGLTQEQMENALGLGAKSLARWENERVLQNRSVDDLLRLVDRDPSALAFLARVHGTTVGVEDLPAICRLDGSKWPKVLVANLMAAAQREGTDLNGYLIMVLTKHITERGFSAVSKRLDDSVRALERYTSSPPMALYEESWHSDHQEVMRESAVRMKYAG